MRLFLLPITRTRTLLYCQRLNVATTEQPGIVDKVTRRAAKLWADWEKRDSGWQKTVVGYGNSALRRIPYEEWGLKSVPPLSSRRKAEDLQQQEKRGEGASTVEVVYPAGRLASDRVEGVLAKLATEREALHRKRLIWCCIGMPISAPFALVPVIPNLPFFYLAYRAWSHWRALNGGKHLQFLLSNKLLSPAPSQLLDDIYSTAALPAPTAATLSPSASPGSTTTSSRSTAGRSHETASPPAGLDPRQDAPDELPSSTSNDEILLSQDAGKRIALALELPELEVEIERAIWQVTTQRKPLPATPQPQGTESGPATKEGAGTDLQAHKGKQE